MRSFGKRRRTVESHHDLNAEMQQHLEEAAERLVQEGMSPEDAKRAARVRFGNVSAIAERGRLVWRWPRIETLCADIKYACRQLRRFPGFALTAILTLALGIGATTAIFTLVNAVLLKSLPVVNPSQLYRLGDIENCCEARGLQDDWSLFSYNLYTDLRDNTQGFESLAAFQAGDTFVGVRRAGASTPPKAFTSEFVSGNYFYTFGISAYLGHVIAPSDDRKSAPPTAVMSYRAWQQVYGSDPGVVGSSFIINGQPVTVIGIAPPKFYGDRIESNPPSFWLPLAEEPLIRQTDSVRDRPDIHWLDLIGRIASGSNIAQIQAHLQAELREWLLSPVSLTQSRDLPLIHTQLLKLSPGGAGVQTLRDQYRDGLHLLLYISLLVLMLACANLANLMLVRSSMRRHQALIRAALGASRTRLISQALTESLVVALLGGLTGIALAFAGTRTILRLAFRDAYIPIHATPSLSVVGFALAISVLTGLLFGVAPAWVSTHLNPADSLRGSQRSASRGATFTQKALVAIQSALSLVLLGAAGLLTVSLNNMQHEKFGFDTNHRYIVHIDPRMAGYKPDQLEALYRQIHENLSHISGVESVSISLYSPLDGSNPNETVYIEGSPAPPPNSDQNNASWNRVTAGYFATMGTHLLTGRPISSDDVKGSEQVAVVNKAFADKFSPNRSPIGMHFGTGGEKNAGQYEVVGVTENSQYKGPLEKIPPMYFLPESQAPVDSSRFLDAIELRSFANLSNLEAQVRSAISEVNPNLTVIDYGTLSAQIDASLAQESMITKLTGLFGILALILAAIGIYGVTSYMVELHTLDIGIRMALGATRSSVLKLTMASTFKQVAVGFVIGVPVILMAGHVMASQLYGVHAYDLRVLSVITVTLTITAFIGAFVPARRATLIDPMRAVRGE